MTRKESIRKSVEQLVPEIVDFTKQLIAIPTENPPGRQYRECVNLIACKVNDFGLETQKIEIPTEGAYPRYALLSYFGTGTKTIYFHGHYDVVPSENVHQFRPMIRGGKLFGRGSADMKGGLATMIYAVKVLQLCNVDLSGRICLVFVPDEETGGTYGTKYLFQNDIIKNGLAMFMPEPSSGTIWHACRGAITLLLHIKGKSVHSTLKHEGVNAFNNMLKVANAFMELKSDVESRQTGFPTSSEKAKHSILMMGGICKGGTKYNVVPRECSFSIDRRLNPEEALKSEKRQLLTYIEQLKAQGINIDLDIIQEGESAAISPNHHIIQTLASTVEHFTGQRPPISLCPGLLEIRYYIRNGIPAVAYGPGLLSVAHGPREYVNIDAMKTCTGVYATTAREVLSTRENRNRC
ncbi:MAG: M20 family metallopeptidase [Candidatus Korarchaeota archaeon]|nr:M20 family metallopeptidase [Candidatus Korarchaeota archaeon]NIU83731.1 ArgE/DapE family deacylase [Candidatus Thorarchaeota archaeon]NIW15684.1 ArgE/DapE family deacylase [Candidatus Thorarchaeota archaeon]NIW52048.1 ArgE/DapE family deacylase [Candidatus Korarchaeota archaeon]